MEAVSSVGSRNTRFVVILAFVVVNVFYVITTVYTQHSLRAIDSATAELTDHTAVRIEQLTQSRGEVRWLGLQVRRAVADLARGRAADAASIDDVRRQLHTAALQYVATARSTDERRQSQMFAADTLALDGAVDQFLAILSDGDAVGARAFSEGPMRAALTRTGEDLLGAIDSSAQHTADLGHQIGLARRRSRQLAFTLAIASVVVTSFAAAVAIALMRRNQRRVIEAEERASQRAEELDHFASRVAHDIRTPLTSTLLSIQRADRQIVGQDSARALLARGIEGVGRIVRLVDALLEFARSGVQPSNATPASLTAVVNDVIAASQSSVEGGIAIQVERLPEAALVCSSGVLTSIVSNLLSNAVKYTTKGTAARITVRAFDTGTSIRVEVVDTGPGVPIHLRDRIFEPYVRAPGVEQPGIGLGLATVKRLVQAHRGQVGVTDNDGGGSRFWFEIPKATRAPTES